VTRREEVPAAESHPVALTRIDVTDAAALDAYLAIRNAVTPDSPDDADQVRWETDTYGASIVRLLASVDGRPVGTASTGRIWMHDPSYDRFWLGLWVLPPSRGRGIGSALYRAVSEAARAAGKTGFQTELAETHVDGHRFLARRGFVEVDRMKSVRLDLAGLEPPSVPRIPGVTLVTLAARPDLLPSVHRVAVETFPDVPTADEPLFAGTLAEFVARDVDRAGVPHDGFVIAVDDATGEAAGYANLVFLAGSSTVAMHDMTAVRPAFRGRGIARALKLATILWAVDHGLEALETGNDEANAPMRAVNARLGYRPLPDSIGLHGPLAPAE
jgi:GNAT superfamily N-acetyltransferase